MDITGFKQLDDANAAEEAIADGRRMEITSQHGSVEDFLAKSRWVEVCAPHEHLAFARYYARHPEVFEKDGYAFAKRMLKRTEAFKQGSLTARDTVEREYLEALSSVAEKCSAYFEANKRSFPLQAEEGSNFISELDAVAFSNHNPYLIRPEGGITRSNYIMLMDPDKNEAIAATSYMGILSPKGDFTVTKYFTFVDRAFRGNGVLSQLDQICDSLAPRAFANDKNREFEAKVKASIIKQGGFHIIAENNQIQDMTLAQIFGDDAGGTSQTDRQVIMGKQRNMARIDTGNEVPYVYIPYDGVAPITFINPWVYKREVTLGEDGGTLKLGDTTTPKEFSAEEFHGHYLGVAVRLRDDADPITSDKTGTAERQLNYYAKVAEAGGTFRVVPRIETEATMDLWKRRVDAIRFIFGEEDLSKAHVYVYNENRKYSPLGFAFGRERKTVEPLTLKRLYNDASFEGVPLKRLIDDTVNIIARPGVTVPMRSRVAAPT